MNNEVLISLLSILGTIIGSCIGAISSSRLTVYRIEQLEEKLEDYAKRAEKIPERIAILEVKEGEMEKRVQNIEKA